MASIIKANCEHAALLTNLARQTFLESHGHSASAADINTYMDEQYREEAFMHELLDPANIYHIIYHDGIPTGYSKIILDCPYPNSPERIAKLERIYILEQFYSLKLGWQLFQFNRQFAKNSNQAGIWLYVWKENTRAISFYTKAGFEIIGSHDFRISATHSNPNHQMLLKF
jgi:ribosomal protein S18 acetylase RimI-like enzyme